MRKVSLVIASIVCFLLSLALHLYTAHLYAGKIQKNMAEEILDNEPAIDNEELIMRLDSELESEDQLSKIKLVAQSISWLPWMLVVFLLRIKSFREILYFLPGLILTPIISDWSPVVVLATMFVGTQIYRSKEANKWGSETH